MRKLITFRQSMMSMMHIGQTWSSVQGRMATLCAAFASNIELMLRLDAGALVRFSKSRAASKHSCESNNFNIKNLKPNIKMHFKARLS